MKKGNCRGASAVELAIIIPILMMLVFGIIEFGFALYDKAVITNASREGARAGIVWGPVRRTEADIDAVVTDYIGDNLITLGASAAPEISVPVTCVNKDDDLTVTVTYPYSFLVLPNFVGGLMGGVTLTAETVMQCE